MTIISKFQSVKGQGKGRCVQLFLAKKCTKVAKVLYKNTHHSVFS